MEKEQEYTMNNFRHRKMGREHLVTTDQGTWTMLSDKEFQLLLSQGRACTLPVCQKKGVNEQTRNRVSKSTTKFSIALNHSPHMS